MSQCATSRQSLSGAEVEERPEGSKRAACLWHGQRQHARHAAKFDGAGIDNAASLWGSPQQPASARWRDRGRYCPACSASLT